jgi:hypothetical protein
MVNGERRVRDKAGSGGRLRLSERLNGVHLRLAGRSDGGPFILSVVSEEVSCVGRAKGTDETNGVRKACESGEWHSLRRHGARCGPSSRSSLRAVLPGAAKAALRSLSRLETERRP